MDDWGQTSVTVAVRDSIFETAHGTVSPIAGSIFGNWRKRHDWWCWGASEKNAHAMHDGELIIVTITTTTTIITINVTTILIAINIIIIITSWPQFRSFYRYQTSHMYRPIMGSCSPTGDIQCHHGDIRSIIIIAIITIIIATIVTFSLSWLRRDTSEFRLNAPLGLN